jgi:hypothetical protein
LLQCLSGKSVGSLLDTRAQNSATVRAMRGCKL